MSSDEEADRWVARHWSHDLTLGEWWRLLADAGYAFATWPTGLGGRSAAPAEARAVATALAAAHAVAAPAGNGPNMGAPTVIEHGTVDQQRGFVAPLARGETQWCQLFSEPGAGSDLASLSTRAVLDGDTFVVTGQKVWSSKADVSEWGMLLARTDPDVPKHRGITFMMIDMRQPGVEVRPIVQMNGASEFSEVFLTEARVPRDHVIGEIDGGWDVARTTLAHERAASAVGAVRGAVVVEAGGIAGNLGRRVGDLVAEFDAAGGAPRRQPPLLGSREVIEIARQAGLADRPALRDQVVRFVVHSEVYRRNGQRLRDLARAGRRSGLDGSAMKLDLAQLSHESRDLTFELLGAAAMLDEAPSGSGASGDIGRIVRTGLSAFVPSLGGGTNEVQRNIIGERTLGLPREPAVDAGVSFRDMRRS
jgi:alkylation response protein AidB-like acyl-CoA dehydrogenase